MQYPRRRPIASFHELQWDARIPVHSIALKLDRLELAAWIMDALGKVVLLGTPPLPRGMAVAPASRQPRREPQIKNAVHVTGMVQSNKQCIQPSRRRLKAPAFSAIG